MGDGIVEIIEDPIALKLRDQNTTGAGVKGYPVLCDNGNVRIYSNLRLDKYIEIPQDAVIYFSEPDNPQGASRIIFKSTAEVKYVVSEPIPASASASITKSFTMSVVEARRITQAQRCTCTKPAGNIGTHAIMMTLPNCMTNCYHKYACLPNDLYCTFDMYALVSCLYECANQGPNDGESDLPD